MTGKRRRVAAVGPQERDDEALAELLERALHAHGVPDALVLRKVKRAREALRDVDDLLETLERYFTAGAS